MVSYSKLLYVHYYVPGDTWTPGSVPDNYIRRANSYYGTVNTVPFDNYYTVGQVLYLGLVKQERLPGTPSGNVLWKMSHAFAFRSQGWNVAYRPSANPGSTPGTADWQTVVNRATALPPYGSNDLNQLFNP